MPRPINIFLLYRRAVSERAKKYAGVTNYQIVLRIAAATQKNKLDKVKNIFYYYAKLEKEYYNKIFSDNKFSPKRTQFTKASKHKRKKENSKNLNNNINNPEY